jgi:3-isopropylmalate/(R)-2-methylmalate dehydratase small subunit
MLPFDTLDAKAIPFPESNIDTDQIIPARFLKKKRGPDYGRYLFFDRRYEPDGSLRGEFFLNRDGFLDAQVMIATENFGCGSAREHAVWTIQDAGFKAVIASSFGDIFYNNCLKNGLLAIRLPVEAVSSVLSAISAVSNNRVVIDLPRQFVLLPNGQELEFEIDAFAKHCLVNGMDELE